MVRWFLLGPFTTTIVILQNGPAIASNCRINAPGEQVGVFILKKIVNRNVDQNSRKLPLINLCYLYEKEI